MIHAWMAVTDDSFMVYAREVFSIRGLCSYLSKYMTKSFEDFSRQKRLGFSKRWTQSHGWPKLEKMQLRGTRDKAWRRVMIGRWDDPDVNYGTVYLAKFLIDQDSNPVDGDFERLGTELAKQMAYKKQAMAQQALARRILYDQVESAAERALSGYRGD